MNKEDKTFLKGLVGNLKTDLESQIGQVKQDLSEQIRHNGVLIENVKSDIKLLCESHEMTNYKLGNLESDMKEVKETLIDYPILRDTVKKHSRRLATLTK